MTRVLVICTGNSCRSQMAEGFLRHRGGTAVRAFSAGLRPKGLHPLAIDVMAEMGVDISTHESKNLQDYLGESFDYIITVCDNAAVNCPAFPGEGKRLHWPFDDPDAAEGSHEDVMAVFRRVRDEIDARVSRWLKDVVFESD